MHYTTAYPHRRTAQLSDLCEERWLVELRTKPSQGARARIRNQGKELGTEMDETFLPSSSLLCAITDPANARSDSLITILHSRRRGAFCSFLHHLNRAAVGAVGSESVEKNRQVAASCNRKAHNGLDSCTGSNTILYGGTTTLATLLCMHIHRHVPWFPNRHSLLR